MAETKDLKSFKCGFESRRSYLGLFSFFGAFDDDISCGHPVELNGARHV